MRKAKIYYKDYLAEYVNHHDNLFITFSMPVRMEAYKENRLLEA
jgi:hypothetical protein